MKAMIFAAGIGSRLKPLTNTKPKALVEVGGTPMLERTILHLVKYGVKDLIINVHHLADQIENFLAEKNNFNLNIQISDEREELLDTGGGIKKASWFFDNDEDFIAINADVITDIDIEKMLKAHQNNQALATLAVRERKSTRAFLFDENMKLSGWKNFSSDKTIITRSNSNLTGFPFSGIHIIHSSIFQHMKSEGKFSIVETYLELSKRETILGYLDADSIWYDIGDISKLHQAEEGIRSN